MSLRNGRFERDVRRVARAKLKHSPSWKEYKRARSRPIRAERVILPLLYVAILAWAIMVLTRNSRDYAAFGLAVYGLGSILTRRQQWSRLLDRLNPNYFYLHHPVPDRTIFREHMKSILWSTTWSVVVFAVGLSFLFHFPSQWALITGLAIAMGFAQGGGLLVLVRFLPRLPGITRLVVYSFYGLVLFDFPFFPEMVGPIQHALMLTPVGSIAFFIAEYELHREFLPLALIPAVAVVALIPFVYARIERSFTTQKLIEDLVGSPESNSDADSEEPLDVEPLPAVIAERMVRDAGAPASPRVRPWLDDFIHRQFSVREGIVCRLLCGTDDTNWTKSWTRGIGIAVISMVPVLISADPPQWVVALVPVLAVILGIPILGGAWAGFTDVWSSGKLAPFYAAFPVGFREIARVILKVNLIRLLAWSPGFILVSIVVGRALSVEPLTSAIHGLQFLFVTICIQPVTVVAKFSKGSNDSKTWQWPAVFLFFCVFTLGVALLPLTIGFLFIDGYLKFCLALGLVAASTLIFTLYRFGYERCYWDLLHELPR